MNVKRTLAAVLALCLMLTLAACSSEEGSVYVQSVAELSKVGGIAAGDRFPGMVVSENTTKIEKDSGMTVAELYVSAGDDVKAGDKLFSYDVEELQLTLEKAQLEQQQLESSIESYTAQIEELQKQYDRAGTSAKLQYMVQIQTNQVDQKEAELNLKTKQSEVAKYEETLSNSTVTAPVDGRVTQISESGTDSYGNELPYITIQQAGSYRVKGTIGELQRGGIVEGDRIRIISRTDETQVWYGTVTLVDYENASQGNSKTYYSSGDSDGMSSGSRYPFYVALDSSDGLLLGQHLYLELDTGDEAEPAGLSISYSFVCYDDDGSTYVWAERNGKLEKRAVTLGETNDMLGTVEITEGLTEDDYIAFPDENCVAGAGTTHTEPTEATDAAADEEA